MALKQMKIKTQYTKTWDAAKAVRKGKFIAMNILT